MPDSHASREAAGVHPLNHPFFKPSDIQRHLLTRQNITATRRAGKSTERHTAVETWPTSSMYEDWDGARKPAGWPMLLFGIFVGICACVGAAVIGVIMVSYVF